MSNFAINLLVCMAIGLGAGCGAGSDPAQQRAQAFDRVWSHLDSHFYDAGFGGQDWAALGRRYRPLALAAPSEEAFYRELNSMLFELGVSHIAVLPDEHPEWIGAPSAFANGEVGLDIRVIEGQMVVVARKPALGERLAEIQPGTVITRLNGKSLDDFLEEVREPPVPALPERMLVTERAQRELFAEPGSEVRIGYVDADGRENELVAKAFKRGSAVTLVEGVPPVYVDFESRVLEGDIGYIRFNSFHPALLEQVLEAIRAHASRPGLVIDLRGNVGGDFNVRRSIAEHLILERSLVWRYVGRRGPDDIVLEPAENAYRGSVVFLVDGLSASSAEELSGAMQALGRARIVGNRTAGLVLVADVLRLDIGASLIYPVAETRFADGYVPEGQGVQPNVEVAWSRECLSRGRDPQLEAALGLLWSERIP